MTAARTTSARLAMVLAFIGCAGAERVTAPAGGAPQTATDAAADDGHARENAPDAGPAADDPSLHPPRPAAVAPKGAADPHVHAPVVGAEDDVDEELGRSRPVPPGCPRKCAGGAATTTLRRALSAVARRARHCYAIARLGNPSAAGTMSVRVRVSETGDVCSAAATEGTLRARGMAACVEKIFRDERGLPGAEGCVDVEIPLKFDPGEP